MNQGVWKYAVLLLAVLLIASNVFWFAAAIDAGISHTHREQVALECESQASQLEVIANHYVSGKSFGELRPFLYSTASPNEIFAKPSEGLVWVGSIAVALGPENTVVGLRRDPYAAQEPVK